LRDWEWRHLLARTDVSAGTIDLAGRALWGGAASADGSVIAVAGGPRAGGGAGKMFAALVGPRGEILLEWRAPDNRVPSVAVSPDGRWFAAGFGDGTIRVRDRSSGTDLPALAAHSGQVIDLEFSADGTRLASGGADGAVRVFDARAWRPVRSFEGAADRVIGVAFDATASRVVAGVRDGSIRVWDTASGALVRVLTGHTASVEAVAVSPDGTRLASASRDRTVRLWDLADGHILAVGTSHGGNVRDVTFAPEGRAFVSASWDGSIRVWDAASGEETGVLHGHEGPVYAIAFTSGAAPLVSFGRDGAIKRWDACRGDVLRFRGLGDVVDSVAFDATGTRVAASCADGAVVVLDAATAAPLWRVKSSAPVPSVAFVPRGSVTASMAEGICDVWPVPSEVCATPTDLVGTRYRCVFETAGGGVWSLSRSRAAAADAAVRLDLATHTVTDSRPVGAAGISLALGREPGSLAVGTDDGRVCLWTRAGSAPAEVPLGTGHVFTVAFDPESPRLLACGVEGIARVLSVPDLATLVALEGHSDSVLGAAFLPGGRRIVTVSRDHTVRIWDAATGENLLVLHGHGDAVTCVAVSPDGSRIATGAGSSEDAKSEVCIWFAPPATR
jgi:WD40 repeat protein